MADGRVARESASRRRWRGRIAGTAAGLVLVAPAPVRAEPWVLVGEHADGKQYYDAGSVTRTGDVATFWTSVMYGSEQTVPNEPVKFWSTYVQHEANCATRTARNLRFQLRDRDGHEVRRWEATRREPQRIEPNSMMARVLARVCA